MQRTHRRIGKELGEKIRRRSKSLQDQQFIKDLIGAYHSGTTPLRRPSSLSSGKDYGQLVKYRHHVHQGSDGGRSFTEGMQKSLQKIGDEYDDVVIVSDDDNFNFDNDLSGIDDDSTSSSSSSSSMTPEDRALAEIYSKDREPYIAAAKQQNQVPLIIRCFKREDAAKRRNYSRGIKFRPGATMSSNAEQNLETLKTTVDKYITSTFNEVNTFCDPELFVVCCDYTEKRAKYGASYLETSWDGSHVKVSRNRDLSLAFNAMFSDEIPQSSQYLSDPVAYYTAVRAFILVYPFTKFTFSYNLHPFFFTLLKYACLVSPTLKTIEFNTNFTGIVRAGDGIERMESEENMRERYQTVYTITTDLRLAVAASSKVTTFMLKYAIYHQYDFFATSHNFINEDIFIEPMYASPKYRRFTALHLEQWSRYGQAPVFYEDNFFKRCELWRLKELHTSTNLNQPPSLNVLSKLKDLKILNGACSTIDEQFRRYIETTKLYSLRLFRVNIMDFTEVSDGGTNVSKLLLEIPTTLRVLMVEFDVGLDAAIIPSPVPLQLGKTKELEYVRLAKFRLNIEYAPDFAATVLLNTERAARTSQSLMSVLLNSLNSFVTLGRRQVRYSSSSSSSSSQRIGAQRSHPLTEHQRRYYASIGR